jgi:hypothetical protein
MNCRCATTYFFYCFFPSPVLNYLKPSAGVVVSVGGQIPNNLSVPLSRYNVKIIGTHPGIKVISTLFSLAVNFVKICLMW